MSEIQCIPYCTTYKMRKIINTTVKSKYNRNGPLHSLSGSDARHKSKHFLVFLCYFNETEVYVVSVGLGIRVKFPSEIIKYLIALFPSILRSEYGRHII